MTALRDTLASRPLRQLLASQIPADFADWLDYVAIAALLAFTWQVDPLIFAVLAVALGLPYLMVGPVAGVLVDRAPIKSVLIMSNLGRGFTTLLFAFAPNWQVLLALVFLRSSIDAFYTPAKQSALQALTTDKNRLAANGLSHAINQSGKIAAPALGGALLIVLEPSDVFLLNAAVSILAAILLVTLPAIPRPKLEKSHSIWADIRTGIDLIASKPTLKGALILMAAGFFAMFLYDTLIAPLTRELGFDATVLGLALTAVGMGGLIGALILGLGKTSQRPFIWAAIGAALSGLTVCAFWLVEFNAAVLSLPAFLTPFAIVGFATAMVVVPIRSIVQDQTPPDQIARVTALSEAANTTALLMAPFIGAFIARSFTIGSAFLVGGILMLALAAYAVWLDRKPVG